MRYVLAIAEDEPDLRDALADYFGAAGFEVIAAGDGPALRAALHDRAVHVALLDITMPGEDGLSLARWLKSRGPVGVIMATALGRPIDRVVGLDIGADDYVVKPYDLRELLARVRSVIRRLGDNLDTAKAASPAPVAQHLRLGPLTIDPDRRELRGPDGQTSILSAGEFAVLHALLARSGRTLSREALADACGLAADGASDRSIDVRILRLRKKIRTLDPAAGDRLETVRGEGYLLRP